MNSTPLVSHGNFKSHPWDKFVGAEARARIDKNRKKALKILQDKIQPKQSKPGRKPDLVLHEWDRMKKEEEIAKREQREIRRLKR